MKILKWGVYLIIFCLPLYLVRLEIFGIPTSVLELMIYGLFVLWLLNKGYKGLWIALKRERLLVWGIILLIIGVSMATVFSWDLRVSAGIWKGWFVDAMLFFLVFVSIIKKEDIKNIFSVLIYSGLVISIISLVYLIQGNFNYQGRLQGIYNSPNFLAMALAPILIILIANIYSRKDTCQSRIAGLHSISTRCGGSAMRSLSQINIRLILFLIYCILYLVILFFTKSFGALLGILIALTFGVIVYLYNKDRKREVLAIIVLIFIVIFVFGMIKISSLDGLKSFDARFVIWQTAWEAFETKPITGIGPGTFQDYFPPYPKWGVPQPHNIFLAFLLQTGITGFIGFILILIWFFSRRLKIGHWDLIILCLMVYVLSHGLVDTTYWKNDLSIIFWIVVGLKTILSRP